MFLKIGGYQEGGEMKKEMGRLIHLSTLWGRGDATSQKFAHSPHLEKNFPSHMEKFPSK